MFPLKSKFHYWLGAEKTKWKIRRHQHHDNESLFLLLLFSGTSSPSALTVAGETRVACVKLGVDSDESMLLFAL